MVKSKRFNLTLLLLIFLLVTICVVPVLFYAYKAGEREVAEELLHSFYTFDLLTIAENDKRISELTTEDIYQSHTIASSNRQLRVYLKFEGNPTKAKIISHKNNIIYYYIESDSFDSNRTFAMQYHYSWGKIDKIVEYEVFLLPQSSRGDLN